MLLIYLYISYTSEIDSFELLKWLCYCACSIIFGSVKLHFYFGPSCSSRSYENPAFIFVIIVVNRYGFVIIPTYST